MSAQPLWFGRRSATNCRGYLLVLFAVIMAFVAVVASMQVLVLTSVATTSRAYDGYQQSAAEVSRLDVAVAETMLAMRQVSIAPTSGTLSQTLAQKLGELTGSASNVTATSAPPALPLISTYPGTATAVDPVTALPDDVLPLLGPELRMLVGGRAAVYPELAFEFSSRRRVSEIERSYRIQVRARYLAVPLTRFSVCAYDLPAEIGSNTATTSGGPTSQLPAGLVPSRDSAFVRDLQSQAGVLPYHFRRRAVVAAAYQYVFSQSFIDRVAEYAGITHYCDLGATSGTAVLAGMNKAGNDADWDISDAGTGSYGATTMVREAAVVFCETSGYTLHLRDTAGDANRGALFILALGPSQTSRGPLVLDLGSLARPVIIIGYNVRLSARANVTVNGAVLLDPWSEVATTGTVTVGHFSYWAGAGPIPTTAVVATGTVPSPIEAMAPRVVLIATAARRL
jgi:hypothetical protein